MITPPFFAVQKQSQNGITTILAVEYTLDPADVDGVSDLHLYVDTLTLPNKPVALPGKNLVILARQIVCPAGCGFDTSGKSYDAAVVPINPPKAKSGTGPGENGVNGINGGGTPDTTAKDGQAAGNISIYTWSITGNLALNAKGGNGQQGQNGQNGGDGINGGPGNDAIINRVQHDRDHPDGWDITPATQGQNGGGAGNGGNAGKSGNGGNGGTILVHTVTALAAGQLTPVNTGGHAGAAATPGIAGTYGHAGDGGRIAVEHDDGTHFHHPIWELSDDRQPGASDGGHGTNGSAASPPATGGRDGSKDVQTVTADKTLFTPDVTTVNLVQLTLDYAEASYMSKDLAKALDYYKWGAQVTSVTTGDAGLNKELAGLHSRCNILQKQIGQGLDYFGNPMNYVPIVTLDYYTQALDGMIATGGQVENVYNQYTAFLSGQTHTFSGMNDAIANGQTAIAGYQQSQKDYFNKITALGTTITQITDALVAQYNVLLAADLAFKKAAEGKNNQCTFASLLGLLKTMISVGMDLYGAFKDPSAKSVTTVIKDFADIGISIEKGNLITNPIVSKGDPDDISQCWKQINPGGGDVDDSKKLVLEETQFDKAIKPYLDMPEAVNYKKQVHDYIGIAQSRNAKLLEYTNCCIQYIALTGTIDQKQAEVDRIKAQIAKENVPGLITYRNFLYSQYQDYKRLCMKYLYQENRAYDYWSQQDNPFNITDNSFTGLGLFHNHLKTQIIDRINTYQQPTQPLKDVQVVLDNNTRAKQFADFQKTGKFHFQIPADEVAFLGWANVLLTNFTIWLHGVNVPDGKNIYIQLWHQGQVVLVDPNGKPTNYTHNQVESVYEYKLANGQPVYVAGGSLGGDGTGGNPKRIALSPFASFSIIMPATFNPGVDYSKVTGIEIHFSGYAVPRVGAKTHG